MKIRFLLLCLLLASSLNAQTGSKEPEAEEEKGFRPLTAALHVHSQFSDGQYNISELTSFAEQRKIDVIGISDSFLTRVRFGIGPLKKLLSVTHSRPGIADRGITEFLDSIEEVQHKFQDVVVLPGVEAAPYYYWTGSWTGQLQLHDFDRHLLIFGLSSPASLANLPVIENATWSNTQHDWLLAAGPLTLFFARSPLLDFTPKPSTGDHRIYSVRVRVGVDLRCLSIRTDVGPIFGKIGLQSRSTPYRLCQCEGRDILLELSRSPLSG